MTIFLRDRGSEGFGGMFIQLVRVQHLLVCWQLQTTIKLRLKYPGIVSFETIYTEFQNAFNFQPEGMDEYIKGVIDQDMEGHLRTSPRSDYKGRPDPYARKAVQLPHKILMPVIWEIEKCVVPDDRESSRLKLLDALNEKRAQMEAVHKLVTPLPFKKDDLETL